MHASLAVLLATLLLLAGCPSENVRPTSAGPSAAPSAAPAAASGAPPAVTPPAASATLYPPLDVACTTDADCDIVGAPREATVGCCTRCGEYVAGTRAWAARAKAACNARPPCELGSSCAEPIMPRITAACTAGKCAVARAKK